MARSAFPHGLFLAMQNTEKPVVGPVHLWGALIGQHGSRVSPRH